MDDAPETRRRIGIVVAQGYRESRQRVQFSCVTPEDAIVTFPAYPDHSFKHLRRLHQKGVQAVVKVVEGESQTEVRVPWSRWVETTPPDLPDTDTHTMPQISKEVMARVESGVEETGAVDVLSDDWGQLGLLDRSAALLLKPLTLPARAAAAARGEEWEDEEGEVEGEGEEEEEEEEQSSPDILKLQMLQRKMMKRIHERRLAAAAAETPLQRFLRHYHARLKDLYPAEAHALALALPKQPQEAPQTKRQDDEEGKKEEEEKKKKAKKKKKDDDSDSIPSIQDSDDDDM